MGKSQTTELQIFVGGLNLMPASHLIKQEEARISTNSNLRKLNLQPLLASLFYEDAPYNFVYNYNNVFEYYPLFRSNVLYNKVWYWSDALGTGKQYSDGTVLPLGITPPVGRLTVAPIGPTSGDGLTGNINYIYTYYDPVSGSESPPSQPSITMDLTGVNANQAVTITDIVPSPDGYESRLYRIGGIITAYSAVVTLDVTETTYTDELSFSEIQAIVLDTLRAYPPPTGLQYLTEHQGRFYGSVNSELFFSAPGKPDSWYALDFIGFENVIAGIVSVANGLIVMTDNKSWLITGISPIQFVKHTLSDSEGCVGFASIATNEGSAIWLSRAGFVMSNGSSVKNISLDKIGRFRAMTPLGAAFLDKRYFLSFSGVLFPGNDLLPRDDLYPGAVVNEEGLSVSPGAVVIDFAMGAPSFSTLLEDSMSHLLVTDSKLYHISTKEPEAFNMVTEDGAFNIVTESAEFNLTANTDSGRSLVSTFENDLRTLNYLSPVLTEGSMGTLKTYEKIRIIFSGELTIKVFDEDSRLFVEEHLIAARRQSMWVGIPVGFNYGYGIQISVYGKCIVDSIMYTWTPKEAQ